MAKSLLNHEKNKNLAGVVLAGGVSRRMGVPKAMLRHNGETFLQLAVSKLFQVCDTVVVSVERAGTFEIPTGVQEIEDIEPEGGAAVGILSALKAIPEHGILVIPVDMPLIPLWLLFELINSRGNCEAVITKMGKENKYFEPLIGIYEQEAAKIFEKSINENIRKMQLILQRLKVKPLIVDIRGDNWFLNINTYKELQQLES